MQGQTGAGGDHPGSCRRLAAAVVAAPQSLCVTPCLGPRTDEVVFIRLWNGFDTAQQEGLLRIVREVAGLLKTERRAQP